MKTQKLFRPVGLLELERILLTEARAFPPRLAWQPIFYPVLNIEYATQISVEWNMPAEPSYCGFVTEFELPQQYVKKYEVQIVGGAMHEELWIPAEELTEMNRQIVGCIQVTRAFYSEFYQGLIENTQVFKKMTAHQQIAHLAQVLDLKDLIRQEHIAIQINYGYWRQFADYQAITDKIKLIWQEMFPERRLIET
ncbi:MAG: hypothetical protein MUE85_00620 [Microscillaceae bacterium]|jgi:hypothetical protein|nr:hypothetical protein [Microscillaceae bacterium]